MADPRLTPARPDLAASHLRGKVEATRFVDGVEFEIFDAVAPVRREPSHDAALETEALKGERVTIYDRDAEGWAWGQLQGDGYVGWLPDNALITPRDAPTHQIVAVRTLAFPGPSIKLPPVAALPLGARLAVTSINETFAITHNRWYLPTPHIAALDAHAQDFVAVAERFIETPYLWGGKTGSGIDCSGLVQVALAACGIKAPRDSDMQQAAVGSDLGHLEVGDLRRGDLIFWNGHVAIVRDQETLLHANAFHMRVAIEPIAEAVTRIAAGGSEVTALRRPAGRDAIDPAFIL